ncbi:MAG: substrate-binding domain-containing protein, partial [Pseudomonadota bacterium]
SALKAQGVRVPEEIGIAGFGNFEVSRFSAPTITTVTVDPRRIGQATGELLGTILATDGKGQQPSRIDVAAVPDLRESTRVLK